MIAGIGLDIVKVDRIKNGYNKFKKKFFVKLFTQNEIDYCNKYFNNFESLAGKFAAKEACMKALGYGIKQGLWFNHIEVLNKNSQAPYIKLHKKAKTIFKQNNFKNIIVTITHTDDTAAAVVIIEK